MNLRLSLPNMSITHLLTTETIIIIHFGKEDGGLTHRNGSGKQADGHYPPSTEDHSRAILSRPFIHHRREGVEQEILDHHLQDEHLG